MRPTRRGRATVGALAPTMSARGVAAGQSPARHGGAAAQNASQAGLPPRQPYEVEDYQAEASRSMHQPADDRRRRRSIRRVCGRRHFVPVQRHARRPHGRRDGADHEPRRRDRRAAMYLNRKKRWNWGFVVEHLPYVDRRLRAGRGRPSTASRRSWSRPSESRRSTPAPAASCSIRSAACIASSSPRACAASASMPRSRRSSSRRSPASCSTNRPRSCRGPTR